MGEEVEKDIGEERTDGDTPISRDQVDVLPYRGEEEKQRRINWRPFLRGLPWLPIFIGIGIAAILDPFAGGLVMIVGVCWVFFDLVVSPIIKLRHRRNISEEEYEAEWEERKDKLKEAVEIAERIYVNGPMGTWRFTRSIQKAATRRLVIESRVIIFLPDGKGVYRRFCRQEEVQDTDFFFEYRVETERKLSVKLVNMPGEQEWTVVEYGFRAMSEGEELYLWFVGENPLPAEMAQFWPFTGEYLRTVE